MKEVAADFFPDDDSPENIPHVVVPDYVAPIVGYRMWTLTALNHLKSFNDEPWYPGKPITAICTRMGGLLPPEEHQPPHEGCSCGIYAFKTEEQLVHPSGYWGTPGGILYGEVY